MNSGAVCGFSLLDDTAVSALPESEPAVWSWGVTQDRLTTETLVLKRAAGVWGRLHSGDGSEPRWVRSDARYPAVTLASADSAEGKCIKGKC